MVSMALTLAITIPFQTIPAKKAIDSFIHSRRSQSTTRTQDFKSTLVVMLLLVLFSSIARASEVPLDNLCAKFAIPTVTHLMRLIHSLICVGVDSICEFPFSLIVSMAESVLWVFLAFILRVIIISYENRSCWFFLPFSLWPIETRAWSNCSQSSITFSF